MELDGSLIVTCEEYHGINVNAVANCAGTSTVQPVRPHAIDLQLAHKILSIMSSCWASLVIIPSWLYTMHYASLHPDSVAASAIRSIRPHVLIQIIAITLLKAIHSHPPVLRLPSFQHSLGMICSLEPESNRLPGR